MENEVLASALHCGSFIPAPLSNVCCVIEVFTNLLSREENVKFNTSVIWLDTPVVGISTGQCFVFFLFSLWISDFHTFFVMTKLCGSMSNNTFYMWGIHLLID